MERMKLEMAIGIQDAIEAINDGVSRADYQAMHDERSQVEAFEAYGIALDTIAEVGTVRKALNRMALVIDSYREPAPAIFVDTETVAGEMPIRLSRSIRVF